MNSAITPHFETSIQTIDVSADRNPAAVFIASLTSEHSRRNMQRHLNRIAELVSGHSDALRFSWHELRFQHTAAIRTRLMEAYAPATVNVMLSALRGVLKTAWRLELLTAEEYHRAIDIENVKAETLPSGRNLSVGEIYALAAACMKDGTAGGARDAAIIGLLYTSGMRRAELVALQLRDYDTEAGRLEIKHGKGRKERAVFITNGAKAALDNWINIRGAAPGALFVPVTQRGEVVLKSISEQAVYKMLQKRGKEAGLKSFTPHDFRRTLVGDLLDAGTDLVTVAEIVGHASTETTRKYDRRGERAKMQAAQKLHFPFEVRGD